MRRFHWNHLRGRVEPKQSHEFRASHAPAFAGQFFRLFPPHQLGLGPGHFQVRHESGRQFPGPLDQVLGSTSGLHCSGQFAAGLLDGEIRIGHGHEGVVLGRLEVGLAGADVLPRHQGAKTASSMFTIAAF